MKRDIYPAGDQSNNGMQQLVSSDINWWSSELVKIRRGCPSTPSRCWRPKSHNTVVVAMVTA